jgi:outer membrane protein
MIVLRSLFLFGVLLATWAPASAAVAGDKMAEVDKLLVVDVQRCILETRQGKSAKKELEKFFAKSEAKLEKKAKKLQQQYQDLQAKAAMLSQAEVGRRQQELMRAQGELQQLQGELQQKVMEKEALLTEKIYKNVAELVRQLALEEKVQLVLVNSFSSVLYVSPRLDVTNRIIVAYDKQFK